MYVYVFSIILHKLVFIKKKHFNHKNVLQQPRISYLQIKTVCGGHKMNPWKNNSVNKRAKIRKGCNGVKQPHPVQRENQC